MAIEAALTLRLVFSLPLRQTEGFLQSIFGLMGIGLSAPDHTTLLRRGQHLEVQLRRHLTGGAIHLVVDSTGLSIVGEGHCQGSVENVFRRYKSILDYRLRARHPRAQESEAVIACNVLNRMLDMGRPVSVAIRS